MSISSLTVERMGDVVQATAVSDLSGVVYFHWFLDGSWIGRTTTGTRVLQLAQGEQARLEVLDSTDDAFDYIANAPAGYPARRTLWWTRPPEADVASFLVEQRQDGGSWTSIGTVQVVELAWSFRFLTARLDDLSSYEWRVTPYDAAGNAGTALALDAERVVRTPDAPDFDLAFDDGTQRVTFSEAA